MALFFPLYIACYLSDFSRTIPYCITKKFLEVNGFPNRPTVSNGLGDDW